MKTRYIFTSLTRISDLHQQDFRIKKLLKNQWATGDYIATLITHAGSGAKIELSNGRMMDPLEGDKVIGAFGVRAATLEATGNWHDLLEGEEMHLLTAAGLAGKMTSRSAFSPLPVRVAYLGHVIVDEKKTTMKEMVKVPSKKSFDIPVILIVGTSMSAGKTTTGRVIIHQLKLLGLNVLGAKLTGAGRYRDILAQKDAGADEIIDFVDGGLPSSICPEEEYKVVLEHLLWRMAQTDADVAVIEIGASPLEPYNGDIAIRRIKKNIRCKILCASDPYAVFGVMQGFDFVPDLVCGPATNTIAAVELVEKLCDVKAVNLLRSSNARILKNLIIEKLKI